jgi:L-ascorbate metabolism protein UlaG (beta-lactamase superfamily)
VSTSPPLFRWLGAAGLEFRYNGFTLLVDPYLSRIPVVKVLFCRIKPDEQKVFNQITAADAILVTHSHFDHLMDVPLIAKKFGSPVYGSPNTCSLLERCAVPLSNIRTAAPGDAFSIGPFNVTVRKSSHSYIPFLYNRKLPKTPDPPCHAFDFVLDFHYSYRIGAGSRTYLTDPGREAGKDAVDVLFINTLQGSRIVRNILNSIDAKVVVPLHWDNYFKPISNSCRAPGWGLWPVRRILLKTLNRLVVASTPRGSYFLPEPFTFYCVEDILYHGYSFPSIASRYGM